MFFSSDTDDDGNPIGADAPPADPEPLTPAFDEEPQVDQGALELEEGVDDQRLDDDLEMRLAVAGLYRVLLSAELFDQASPAAATVKRRVRGFIKDELSTLLGVGKRSEPVSLSPAASLTEDEVRILKAIVNKTRSGAFTAGATSAVAATVPAQVQARPAAVQAVPAPKPAALPPQLRPQPPKPAPPKPQPPAAKPAAQAPKPAPTAPPKGVQLLAREGTEVPGEEIITFRRAGRKIRQWKKGGRVVQEHDITEQVRPAAALPMPDPQMMFIISQQQASDSVNNRMSTMAKGNDRSGVSVISNVIASGDVE